MKNIEEIESFELFLEEYKNYNEKRKYFIIDENFNVKYLQPSYIIELSYIYFKTKNKKILEKISFKDIFIEKEKKISRISKLSVEELKDKFRRCLVNRDSVHILKLGNELLRKSSKDFFEILYSLSKISDDQCRLIKTYFFERIYNEIGLNLSYLRNLLRYFTSSKEGYLNIKEIDNLYKYIYLEKFKKNLDENIKNIECNDVHNIMFQYLLGGEKQC